MLPIELSPWVLSAFFSLCDFTGGISPAKNKIERIIASREETTLPTDIEWLHGGGPFIAHTSSTAGIIHSSMQYLNASLPILPITEAGNRLFDSLIAECNAHTKKRPLVKI
ncbi:MAG TPA: hypothetical protein PKE31_03585 [Pseudomonadota bacterium]|nr:hypothetical protein [Pseudomonadota bacterium]